MFEFRSGGRRVSSDEFFENLKREAIEHGMSEFEQRIHAAAASVVDPETGKHAEVFIRRTGETQLVLRTRGSPAFARELERRLGIDIGSIETGSTAGADGAALVYLAHGSEDHDSLAKPLAERLIASGVDVWLDGWEIRAGDSLRRKMDEGLSNCTHFAVILTPNSLHKPWVETEIDAGFVRAVGGESRFIALRIGVSVNDLSPFLRSLHCPEVSPAQTSDVDRLIADIYGVTRKPELGSVPRYVKKIPEGLKGWSPAAAAVAEYLVRNSELGRKFDPQVTVADIAQAVGLPEDDVCIGVLDLADAGLVERSMALSDDGGFWPTNGLFVEFDRHFLDFNSEQDAAAIVNRLINDRVEFASASDIAAMFSEWPPRRLNSALNYLDGAKIVQSLKSLDSGPWTLTGFRVTDQTRRFARDRR
jgi:hypothetical protein